MKEIRNTYSHNIYDARRIKLFSKLELVPIIDLQRFASAEDEGRTELPSERYKREEKRKGNVLRSQEVVSAFVMLGIVFALFFCAFYMLHSIKNIFLSYLEPTSLFVKSNLNISELKKIFQPALFRTALVVFPLACVGMLMAIVGNVVQFGFILSGDPLSFKLERIAPDFKKVLPNAKTMFSLLKIMMQISCIGTAAYLIIVNDYLAILKSANTSLQEAIWIFAWVSFKLLLVAAVILAILSVPDYFYQRYEYLEKLKMNISESRKERKETEGDPFIRQRQIDAAYELRQKRNTMEATVKADVLITNPTHYAVALQYNPEFSPAPVIIAKGEDHLAFLMRNIAKERDIHIEENPPLARLLYNEIDVGQEIPENLYQVISLIFAKLKRFQSIQNT